MDKDQKKLTWFTCYGNAFDSAQLTDIEYKYITDKTITPFDFYKQFCLENIAYLEDAESHFRQFGKDALKDTVYNHQVVYNTPLVKSAANTLQKVLAMENLLKKQCLQLAMFNSKSPSHVNRNDSFLLRKSLAGKMVRKGDTTTYYNTYLLGSATQIVINKRSPGKMFVYNRQEQVMDSVPLKSEKYASLLKEKEDVFLLYRGWLELQSQQILDARRMIEGWLSRKDTGLYTQTNLPEGKQQLWSSMLQLEKQQQAIEVKIGNLLLPDQEVVKNMLQDAYPDAPSEVSYLGSLGFAYTIAYTRGQKEYELTDHRGNVMATVSDKKKGIDEDQDGIIEYYNADVVNANDYYPFGSLMPGRNYHAGDKYRYGFNGKENDNEVKGEGNQQDYGMRVYDPRIGRFLSVDPITNQYPELTPYQFASNRPIDGIDLDGLEHSPASAKYMRDNTSVLRISDPEEIKAVRENQEAAAFKLPPQPQATISQDYKQTIWGSKGGFEYSKKMFEYEANLLPGGSIGMKALKKERITGKDVAIEAAISFIPIGKVFRGLRGAGREVLEQVARKTDNLAAHLTEKDIAGAIRDINGNPVEINGYVYDHLDEVTNAIQGLENQINKLNKAINGDKITGEMLDAAKKMRSDLQTQKDKIQAVIDRAKNAAKKTQAE
ncbi:RHS repeat-associated core domain-containing protein [Chitinophaga sp. GbtcB8]|uniref:RHS repeat-associated core domain-containing protein n=1 Tax=Chitinophaga sp. GbtcB8 TaxID=2824753 RepID=UPI001C306580|nr:RHS repeat-associated core domain-containing protein [Chitinophaga sp. GbtcB8]